MTSWPQLPTRELRRVVANLSDDELRKSLDDTAGAMDVLASWLDAARAEWQRRQREREKAGT